jgi:hypothetical protein
MPSSYQRFVFSICFHKTLPIFNKYLKRGGLSARQEAAVMLTYVNYLKK